MKIYNGFLDKRLKARPRAVAIGVFDGVHRGHQKILFSMLSDAKRLGLSPCVVTFDPHPEKVLGRAGADTEVLMALAHRLRFFEQLGAGECVVVKFNRAFSRISADRFLCDLLIKRLGMRSLSVGKGFRFGSHAQGNEEQLREAAHLGEFRFHAIAPLKLGGEVVSSTRIRRLVLGGHLRKASALLGRPVSVAGTVVAGRGRGKKIGFPTANLDPHHEILPPEGVYAAWGKVGAQKYPAAVSIGPRPTFSDKQKTLEVHFPGLSKNLYGKDIELEFVRHLRPIQRFANPAELVRAIQADIDSALNLLK